MTPYVAILSSRFKMLLQYRAAAIAGAVTQIFFGIVRMMIFDAFFQSSVVSQPMAREDVISYIWLGQAFFLLTMIDVDKEVAAMIRTGHVAYELTRPLDLYSTWFARALSGRAAPLALRSFPVLVVAGLFLGLQAPSSSGGGALFAVALVCGLLLAASMIALLTISMLWTISGEGISRLASAFIFFFSGINVPLPFFPEWLQGTLATLPFRGLIDTPFRIYTGHLQGAEALAGVAHQLAWIGVFVMFGRSLLDRGLRRLVVQGG